jgi:hypothetical protein
VVREFVAQFTTFIDANPNRIAEIGIPPTELTARATRVLGVWQQGSRLDLPGLDEQSILRPENLPALPHGTPSGVMPRRLRQR